ncbi:MAG: peptide-methionine (S)-S-oxide reductase MsrA [Alphaproteobacteria bacterium]|nr:peptide-methionine (S)-S-oxide reductase MsrA [Alphaproteobacteria bacterium]MCB9930231.1 peptide-methionine (S)-S-oxide reductase MsrA [Alphaproteobacteria bacterium]
MRFLDEIFGSKTVTPDRFPHAEKDIPPGPDGALQTAVLGGGCFWCTEAVYLQLDGVEKVVSGYAGGDASTADYQTVCTGMTKHAEVVEVTFDPRKITYGEILKVFFAIAHDPTQLNRQGNDVGPQYRSAIFYADLEQKAVAEAYIRQVSEAKVFDQPVVTTLEPLDEFFPGEAYHQNYAANNPFQPYIAYFAAPKVEKVKKAYAGRLKAE